jgi:alkylhydroperoxidase/carboxymuconolactone decarboxylase family protein
MNAITHIFQKTVMNHFFFTFFSILGVDYLFTTSTTFSMSHEHYFEADDLKNFGKITDLQAPMGKKFFDYYGEVFKEGALTEREKSLIALAVAHTVQCPYCIDAYSGDCLSKGADEEQMMEAVHVAAAIKAGATLVYSTQMMAHLKKKQM